MSKYYIGSTTLSNPLNKDAINDNIDITLAERITYTTLTGNLELDIAITTATIDKFVLIDPAGTTEITPVTVSGKVNGSKIVYTAGFNSSLIDSSKLYGVEVEVEVTPRE